jgi:hypothetical protein
MRLGLLFLLLILPVLGSSERRVKGEWGFYGHRLINRMAVYTLPPEMMLLFKPNIEFITEHAVDPDKRRYASLFEASRHYMDLDHWGQYPYHDLPRDRTEAQLKYSDIIWYKTPEDSVVFSGVAIWRRFFTAGSSTDNEGVVTMLSHDFPRFFQQSVMPHYYDDSWEVDCKEWSACLGEPEDFSCDRVIVIDGLSTHGILPYHLISMQRQITEAFIEEDKARIIRLCAEMGHYLGDAHVPLHTTSNYNGQLTGQLGIHAFWESRIPELFAEESYDFFVGKAVYISNPAEFFWNTVLESNALVDSVLMIERRLRQEFPSDQQYCFDDRLDATVRTQCREYAWAYQQQMNGMVEQRMRQAVRAIGSAWYSAWVDAGQPDFRKDLTFQYTDNLPGRDTVKADPLRKTAIRNHE